MMAFIHQEAKEKAEEIEAKVHFIFGFTFLFETQRTKTR